MQNLQPSGFTVSLDVQQHWFIVIMECNVLRLFFCSTHIGLYRKTCTEKKSNIAKQTSRSRLKAAYTLSVRWFWLVHCVHACYWLRGARHVRKNRSRVYLYTAARLGPEHGITASRNVVFHVVKFHERNRERRLRENLTCTDLCTLRTYVTDVSDVTWRWKPGLKQVHWQKFLEVYK